MKILGVDYGTKRIGLAISDENEIIAVPKETIKNDKNTIEYIVNILEQENINTIILGESLNQKGEKNILMKDIEEFISILLEKVDIDILKEKEFFTSFEAHGREGKERFNDRKIKKEKTDNLDAKAAAIILQRYLDRKNR